MNVLTVGRTFLYDFDIGYLGVHVPTRIGVHNHRNMQMANCNELIPYNYINYLLEQLRQIQLDDIESLLPWNVSLWSAFEQRLQWRCSKATPSCPKIKFI